MNDMASPPKTVTPARSRAAKWTRRGFIGAGVVAGGALLIGVGVRPGNPVDELGPKVAGGEGEQLINSWLKIDADNVVTAIVPHCEMGQGAHSVLAQMLADELDADWSKVRTEYAPANPRVYGNPHPLLNGGQASLASIAVWEGDAQEALLGEHACRLPGIVGRVGAFECAGG